MIIPAWIKLPELVTGQIDEESVIVQINHTIKSGFHMAKKIIYKKRIIPSTNNVRSKYFPRGCNLMFFNQTLITLYFN